MTKKMLRIICISQFANTCARQALSYFPLWKIEEIKEIKYSTRKTCATNFCKNYLNHYGVLPENTFCSLITFYYPVVFYGEIWELANIFQCPYLFQLSVMFHYMNYSQARIYYVLIVFYLGRTVSYIYAIYL